VSRPAAAAMPPRGRGNVHVPDPPGSPTRFATFGRGSVLCPSGSCFRSRSVAGTVGF